MVKNNGHGRLTKTGPSHQPCVANLRHFLAHLREERWFQRSRKAIWWEGPVLMSLWASVLPSTEMGPQSPTCGLLESYMKCLAHKRPPSLEACRNSMYASDELLHLSEHQGFSPQKVEVANL